MLYFSTMDQPIPEDEAHALIIVEAREDGRKARMKSKQKHAASEALAECFSILLPSEGASD